MSSKRCQKCQSLHDNCCLLLNGLCGTCIEGQMSVRSGDSRWKFIEISSSTLQNCCQSVIFGHLTNKDEISPLLQSRLKAQWEANDLADQFEWIKTDSSRPLNEYFNRLYDEILALSS